jgi:hypothetical protein
VGGAPQITGGLLVGVKPANRHPIQHTGPRHETRDTYGAGVSPRYPPGGDRGSFETPLARRTQGAQHRGTERARWSMKTSTKK